MKEVLLYLGFYTDQKVNQTDLDNIETVWNTRTQKKSQINLNKPYFSRAKAIKIDF